ncbi:hypothetical protein X777_13640 [Ooceraea biroi]|uniref:Uncharacterized protein n=1 Tax=Ooceraea biroi TaxID=2015173 RepID=A0A026WXP6_OOCBI|nr:hypothetical protein X777_13640 [Ooceraea biroi]
MEVEESHHGVKRGPKCDDLQDEAQAKSAKREVPDHNKKLVPNKRKINEVNKTVNIPTDTQGRSNKGNDILYLKTDTGPFRAILSYRKIDKENPPKPLSILEVGRNLYKMGIKYDYVEKCSRYRWQICFSNRSAANDAIKNKYLQQSQFDIFIQWFMVYRRIVIRDVPLDISIEEINDEVKRSNPGIGVHEEGTSRLRRRITKDGTASYVDSKSVKLDIRTQSIPSVDLKVN